MRFLIEVISNGLFNYPIALLFDQTEKMTTMINTISKRIIAKLMDLPCAIALSCSGPHAIQASPCICIEVLF